MFNIFFLFSNNGKTVFDISNRRKKCLGISLHFKLLKKSNNKFPAVTGFKNDGEWLSAGLGMVNGSVQGYGWLMAQCRVRDS